MPLTTTDKLLLSGVLPTPQSQARLRTLLAESDAAMDWPALVRRAEFHHLTALLRLQLNQIDALSKIPPALLAQINAQSQTWAARHLAYVSEASRLITALADANIPALPLKGAALMLGGFYPKAGLRAATDIDLLVPPDQLQNADAIAAACGYEELPGRRQVRQRQRLANERNHLWPRRGPSGLVLELHHRAFQYARRERDFSFAEMLSRATRRPTTAGSELLLPATADLALHLVHHTMVDLQTTRAILRTFADLHFLFQHEPAAQELMLERARAFGFGGAAQHAVEMLNLLAEGTVAELERALEDQDTALLVETALLETTLPISDAARLLEYFDFSQSPLQKLGNIAALLFTPRAHLAQVYGESPASGSLYLKYLRRPFDLLRKFARGSFSPASLWHVWKWRRMSAKEKLEKREM